MEVETPPRAWGRLNSRRYSRRYSRKHPHVRGEDHLSIISSTLSIGNTPTCVGKTERGRFAVASDGNTPTCVGKTEIEPVWVEIEEKHPHVRGEDSAFHCPAATSPETPPRAWGRPASPHLSSLSCRKHPHVRGEDKPIMRHIDIIRETPPRAWGRRLCYP